MSLPEFKKNCLFISPHLDDAILSCGGLMRRLIKKKHNIIIATVFSGAQSKLHSRHTRRYMKQCGLTSIGPEDFFRLRRQEDVNACRVLGVKHIHLGFSDACWRLLGDKDSSIWKKILKGSDYRFVYPNHESIFSGQPRLSDQHIIREIKRSLSIIIEKYSISTSTIFGPLGIGGHVDHIIVNKLLGSLPVIYWSDFPYSLDRSVPVSGFSSFIYSGFLNIKRKAIMEYRSQLNPLFNGNLTLIPETYYINEKK